MIFEQALELLVAREKRKKFGQTDKPRTKAVARPAEHSRYVSPDLRRKVYARDGGQCRFVGRDGQRCSARDWLEFHHDGIPYGRGGVTSVDNVCLMCRAHNALLAERAYGREFMRGRIAGSRGASRLIRFRDRRLLSRVGREAGGRGEVWNDVSDDA